MKNDLQGRIARVMLVISLLVGASACSVGVNFDFGHPYHQETHIIVNPPPPQQGHGNPHSNPPGCNHPGCH